MLEPALKQQLSQYLAMLREPIELVASLGEDAKSAQTRELLDEIASLSDKVSARFDGEDARRPSFTISPVAGAHGRVRFAGLPLGHEFTSLVLALLWAGGHPPKVADETLAAIADLPGGSAFEMYFSLTCHNCPDVVQALTLIALRNPGYTATMIEGGTYQAEVEARGVMAVPAAFKDGEMWLSGKKTLEEIVAALDVGAEAKAAAAINAKAPFEVLVVGGGPAGAAA
ncbi:MAG TPA: thioredoxin family protein, partial [Novosphingobium sp.]|nr:thioredoxin family protein [Novosphingobium sp.]